MRENKSDGGSESSRVNQGCLSGEEMSIGQLGKKCGEDNIFLQSCGKRRQTKLNLLSVQPLCVLTSHVSEWVSAPQAK